MQTVIYTWLGRSFSGCARRKNPRQQRLGQAYTCTVIVLAMAPVTCTAQPVIVCTIVEEHCVIDKEVCVTAKSYPHIDLRANFDWVTRSSFLRQLIDC